jgi:hypothetical protein
VPVPADEILLAITWNAAKALGAEKEVGHLNPGAWGDAVAWECESLEELRTGCRPCGPTACSCAAPISRCRPSSGGCGRERDRRCVPNFSEGRRA